MPQDSWPDRQQVSSVFRLAVLPIENLEYKPPNGKTPDLTAFEWADGQLVYIGGGDGPWQ